MRNPYCQGSRRFFEEVAEKIAAALPAALETQLGEDSASQALQDGSWPGVLKETLDLEV